jgi:hypothetical protein
LSTIVKLVDAQPVIELRVCDALQYKPTAMASPAATVVAVDTDTEVLENALLVLGGWRRPGVPRLAKVTEAGTASSLSLLASAIVEPAGAALAMVTVQVLEALWTRLVGLQLRLEISTGATRLIIAVWELPPKVAVTVAT